ncbi:MAG: uncharacterized protein A8A55_2134 [Amphiamblys sp. WSBS2006]|nr:MAG: uncharacterized protein A8A55_2134 [Amphiamblys sp. WSBS2006]
MYQAAMYAVLRMTTNCTSGKHKINIAAISMPFLASRLGSIKAELGDSGMIVGKRILNIGILQVWDVPEDPARKGCILGSCLFYGSGFLKTGNEARQLVDEKAQSFIEKEQASQRVFFAQAGQNISKKKMLCTS